MEPSQENITNGQVRQATEESCELRILLSLRRIMRVIDIHSHKLASLQDVTGPQLGCLKAIRESEQLIASDLAKKVSLSASTVAGIVGRLEGKKLVERNRSSKDRRQVHISIAPKGEKLLATAPFSLQDTLRAALDGLPEAEQLSLSIALERLVGLIESRRIDPAHLST
jgi:DNA-binding MarR family transcriptional regulator